MVPSDATNVLFVLLWDIMVIRRKALKTSTEKWGEAVWGYASKFTGHLARYTQSGYLIGLRRMTAQSPNRPVLQGHGMATICVERALPWPNSDLIQI